MKIKKSVITAAGRGQQSMPLQTLVDRDGQTKTALQILIEEVVSAGADEICVVISPGDRQSYTRAAGEHAGRLHFVEQDSAKGYGHALRLARAFTGSEPFLHLVSDHLPLSRVPKRCAQQLVEAATAQQCAVSAVQATREHMLSSFGFVGGRRVPKHDDLYEIEQVLEKPTPTEAEQTLLVPGLRSGYYLAFFGMHVLTGSVMDLLEAMEESAGADQKIQLSPALAKLARRERYLALQVRGTRFDLGAKYGLLHAQLALALDGAERDEVLAQLVELLAMRSRGGQGNP